MKCVRLMVVAALLAGLAAAAWNDGFDWPCWRGPDGNGISKETDWDAGALAGGPKVLWTADIGMGYSSVAINDDRLYTAGMVEREPAVYCLNASTGETMWKRPYTDFLQPQSTPAVDGDRVYAIAATGMLLCLHATDGEVLLQRHIVKDCMAHWPSQFYASSPVVEGGLVLANANTAGMALDKMTGTLEWSVSDTMPSGS